VAIVIVPVSEAELDWLVAKKYLAEEERENKVAIKHAIESVLSARRRLPRCDVVTAIPQTGQGQRAQPTMKRVTKWAQLACHASHHSHETRLSRVTHSHEKTGLVDVQ
jgi:hypothetical protein